MIEAGLDAINISVDAGGKEVFERHAHRAQLRQGHRQHRAPRPDPRRARAHAAQADPVVRAPEQLGRRAGVHRALAGVADKIHITDLHNWAGTLNHESDVNYPCYRPWLTFTVLWDGRVSLCCADFDGRTILGDLSTSSDRRRSGTPSLPRASAASTSRAAGPDVCRSCDLPRKDSPLWITKLA